jgi:hypothetical protein
MSLCDILHVEGFKEHMHQCVLSSCMRVPQVNKEFCVNYFIILQVHKNLTSFADGIHYMGSNLTSSYIKYFPINGYKNCSLYLEEHKLQFQNTYTYITFL